MFFPLHLSREKYYKGVNKSIDVAGDTFTYDSSIGMYYGKVSDLNAAELRSVLTVTVMENGEEISDTITYSIETYAKNRIEASGNPDFVELLEKMMVYGDSAETYFEEKEEN